MDRRGRIDVLVNNAGNAELSPVSETSLDGWRAVIDTHLTGAFLCSKHAATAMVERDDGGEIINIGSMYSVYGAAGIASYGTAKTGVLGLTRALAVELAEHGIQVNAILPGWFETDLTRGMPDSEWGRIIRRKTPADRRGDRHDAHNDGQPPAGDEPPFRRGHSRPGSGHHDDRHLGRGGDRREPGAGGRLPGRR
ncbi:MAG: SDR family oxidoreductase [Actinomycetota bacterium]|nr:SDR family oxidoreductase [Actinomycetota bacterium]